MNTSVKIQVNPIGNKKKTAERHQPKSAEELEIERLMTRSLNFEPPNMEKFNARALMFSFLSEVEMITDERNISKKELAKLVGTSPSYITQLYRGNKIASLEFLARLATVLNIDFKITATSTT